RGRTGRRAALGHSRGSRSADAVDAFAAHADIRPRCPCGARPVRARTHRVGGDENSGDWRNAPASNPTGAHLMTAKSTAAADHGWFGTETVKTRLGNFYFKNSYP